MTHPSPVDFLLGELRHNSRSHPFTGYRVIEFVKSPHISPIQYAQRNPLAECHNVDANIHADCFNSDNVQKSGLQHHAAFVQMELRYAD
jgi:hypothetical protein